MKKLFAVIISVMFVALPLTVSARTISGSKISVKDILDSVKNYKNISVNAAEQNSDCPIKNIIGKNLKGVVFDILTKNEIPCTDCENTNETEDVLKSIIEKFIKTFPEIKEEPKEEIPEQAEEPEEREEPEEPEEHEEPEEPEEREDWHEPEIILQPGRPEQIERPEPEHSEPENTYKNENEYVNEVLSLVNKYRNASGLNSVTLDENLCEAAQIRAKETRTSFSHTRPSGKSCFTVLSDLGISYRGAGENIAYGQSSPDEVMTAWMNSEGHRANIMNPSFTKLGVGVYSVSGIIYWAQMFTY